VVELPGELLPRCDFQLRSIQAGSHGGGHLVNVVKVGTDKRDLMHPPLQDKQFLGVGQVKVQAALVGQGVAAFEKPHNSVSIIGNRTVGCLRDNYDLAVDIGLEHPGQSCP